MHTLTHPAKLPQAVQARLLAARDEHAAHSLSAPTAADVLSQLAAESGEEDDA